MRIRKIVSQSTVEYAVTLAVVAAALLAMQVYLKRGLQGRIKSLSDQLSPVHYESGQTDSNSNTTQSGTLVEEYLRGTVIRYQDGTKNSTAETIVRNSYEKVYPEETH